MISVILVPRKRAKQKANKLRAARDIAQNQTKAPAIKTKFPMNFKLTGTRMVLALRDLQTRTNHQSNYSNTEHSGIKITRVSNKSKDPVCLDYLHLSSQKLSQPLVKSRRSWRTATNQHQRMRRKRRSQGTMTSVIRASWIIRKLRRVPSSSDYSRTTS